MADNDKTKATAANVQADAVVAKVLSKGALRRKLRNSQTSLSSPSRIVMPGDAQSFAKIADAVAAPASVPQAVQPVIPEMVTPEIVIPEVAVEPAALEIAAVSKSEPAQAASSTAEKRGRGRPRKTATPSLLEEVSSVAAKSDKPAAIETDADRPLIAAPELAEPISAQLAEALVLAEPIATEPEAPVSLEEAVTPEAPMHDIEFADPITPTNPTPSSVFSIKDMTMDMSANFNGFQGAMSEAQAKAQAAFEKSSSMLTEAGNFTKGNVEAMIESTKIFAEGVKDMSSGMVAESKTALEAMTGDIKELAAVKSPTDFFKLQSEMVRKNFDSAVAQSSKNTETFLKLMSDAFAPVSGRVSLAVEKARQVVPMNAAAAAPMTVNA